MSAPAIKRVAVLGAGQMGLGIAFVSALHGKASVKLYEPSRSALDRGLGEIDRLLGKDVKKGKLTEEGAKEARGRIQSVQELKEIEGVELIMEATPEKLETKKSIIESLSAGLERSPGILGTNTSSLSISKLASYAPDPSRVIGLHWFNPVPVMKLVELIPALQTAEETVQRARAFAESCGKEVTVSKDVPGFVANAVLIPFLNEAILTLERGVATAQDIDKTFMLGMAHPMGPLKLADFIGLDTVLSIQTVMANETGDGKYRPSVLLGRMVDAGWLGRKSGKGFYEYPAK